MLVFKDIVMTIKKIKIKVVYKIIAFLLDNS